MEKTVMIMMMMMEEDGQEKKPESTGSRVEFSFHRNSPGSRSGLAPERQSLTQSGLVTSRGLSLSRAGGVEWHFAR